MARTSSKPTEQLAQERAERERREAEREAFKAAVVDGRRYRGLDIETLMEAQAVIEKVIQGKKRQAIEDLKQQQQAIAEKIAQLNG